MTTHDRAAELWGMPDMWRAIQPWLVLAAENAANDARWFALDLDDYTGPGVEAELRRKFAAGEAEHGRDWLHMTQEQVREEIRNELRDLVLYHAMILARWQDTTDGAVSVPPFTTNADPGDEQPTCNDCGNDVASLTLHLCTDCVDTLYKPGNSDH